MYDKVLSFGLILGMIFLWIWNWALMRILLRQERQLMDLKRRFGQVIYPEEQRCPVCREYGACAAADTGVIYPCEHYTPMNFGRCGEV